MEYEPPLLESFNSLFQNIQNDDHHKLFMFEECKLPLINLSPLVKKPENDQERRRCEKEIVDASSTWGFFQVTNHGIPKEVLKNMELEAKKMFRQPFKNKIRANFLNLSAESYRWGNPSANCARQFIWSEAMQITLADLSKMDNCTNLRSTIEVATTQMASLAERLTKILAENLGVTSNFFQQNCSPSTSFMRLNRYPPCPVASPGTLFGLVPHTDSDFLTVLHQDQVGGLQLLKDGTWFSVKPREEDALVINIGDFFQAWSNGVYKSVYHRVMANREMERFSVAYFQCPYQDAVIESPIKPSIYRKFTFRDYKDQIRDDIHATGDKIGLSKFLR